MTDSAYAIQNVVILGSGTMGSQIAAHCVNAGLNVTLLDLKAEGDDPDKTVKDNIKKLAKMKPAPLALPEYLGRIRPGNFEDDMGAVGEADWICEAIVEKMEIKRSMMAEIGKHRREGSIVSSNTSGLPIEAIGQECSEEFQQHFLGTHFFNPPRYMKLLEIISTSQTGAPVEEFMKRFCERTLGKGVVIAHDTPNFIANRIGIFSMASIMPWFFDGTFRAEEIDFLTGTLTGYSKAATFRTADMSGLDIIAHVAENLYPEIPDDERREVFRLPERFRKMVEEGKHGNKSGEGFYKKVQTDAGKQYRVIDPEYMEYETQKDVYFDSSDHALDTWEDSRDRLKYMVGQEDRAGSFLWKIHADLLLYAARRVPEITGSVESIDRAMKWGFNWELGPFERWDAIGVRSSVERMRKEGRSIPESVEQMLQEGREQFYNLEEGTVYNIATGTVEPLTPPAEGAVTVRSLQDEDHRVMVNDSAGLYDLGDGIALFEFRTRKHTLGFELIDSLIESCSIVKDNFDALVISHDGANFSYGANLMEAMQAWKAGEKERVRDAVARFQETATGLRYQPFPVVAAPFGMALGGGTEFMLYADRVVAHHELYAGLVEVGVGLLPAGGGTTEMVRRAMAKLVDDDQVDPLPSVKEAFKTVGMAKVSDGAPMALRLGFLRESDSILMNRDLLIASARQEARLMADNGYRPPAPPMIRVMGTKGFAALKLMLYVMHESEFIGDYDRVIGEKVAYVMSGGELSEPQEVPESYLLKLEREAFMELLEDERTQKRIAGRL